MSFLVCHKSKSRAKRSTFATHAMTVIITVIGLTFVTAISASQASLGAKSSQNQVFSTGKIQLTAVSAANDSNSGTSLTLNMPSKRDFFFLKNFGTETLNGFTITQTLASSTLRYCVNQLFKSGSTTQCADNSSAISVGNGINPGHKVFTTPLTSGNSYQFSSTATGNGSNTISVSVSAIDYTPFINNS